MGYLKYSEYRQPEIHSPYLIPTHWKEKKFRFLFTFGRGLGITKSDLVDEGIACINYGEIHSKYGFEIVPEKQDLKCVVESYLENSISSLLNNGDFVFADTSEDLEGSGNFAHLNSNVSTFAGYHTVIARPTGEHLSRFLAYFIDSSLYRSQIRKSVSGVKVFSITQAILKNSYIWLPPIDEQEKIAVFLDNKTQKIDSLIKKKKELIEKLEEQRIAVITQAVTKGIDENAKLKPSGVDWLGDVPKNWNVVKFKYFIGYQEGPGIMAVDFKDEGVPLLRIRNVQNGYVEMEGCNYLDPAKVERTWSHFKCKKDDLIISGSASTGLVSEVRNDAVGSIVYTGLIRLWPYNEKIEKDYICLLVSSELFSSQIDQLKTGSTIQHFGPEQLRKILIILPPIEEQLVIVNKVKSKLDFINELIEKAQEALLKLAEYRSAIITSAVTGKIDVREIEMPEVNL